MKAIHSLFITALMLTPLSAVAYQKADNMEQAKALVSDNGYAIVTYAEGWDKHSRKTALRMMKDPAVSKALGNAVVMTLGVPNVSPPELHEDNKARFGNLDLSYPNVYPAILLYDKTGRRVADVCIMYQERNNPTAIASKISQALQAAAKQNKLLEQAENAKGAEKARLLGLAAVVEGAKSPGRVDKTMQKEDPEDKCGLRAAYNLYATAIESAKTKDWEADLEKMKKLLDHPELTTEQKQLACCISIGLLRRNGGPQRMDEMRGMIARLRSLDPDSLWGKAAIDAERMWVSELSLASGWSPAVIPAEKIPVEIRGPLPIKSAGTYEITFSYRRGKHAAFMTAVELYDGKKKVAEDRHDGTTGGKNSKNVYTLKVPANVSKPHLYVTFNMPSKRDSYGRITIEKK